MADEKFFRPLYPRFGVREHVQTIAATSGVLQGTEATNYGVTVVTVTGSGAGRTVTLKAPQKGIRKTVIVTGAGGSTVPCTVQTHSSGATIGGTTSNTIVFSTTVTDPATIDLVGASTLLWYLASPLPSGVTLAAATHL